MKIRFWWGVTFLILLAVVVIFVGILIDKELVWGLGIALLLFLVITTPVFAMRVKRLGRYDDSKALARWTYSTDEAK